MLLVGQLNYGMTGWLGLVPW